MSSENEGLKGELARVQRVSDMLCTCHASLRDRYDRRALVLDFSILGTSTWMTALAFVAPQINLSLTPFGLNPQLWMGLLSVTTLVLAIAQIKTDWKGRSDAHRRTFDLYAEVKREAGYVLASGELEEEAYRRVLSRYDLASASGIEIPERSFLREKRKHRMKIAISKYLDAYPGTSIPVARLRIWVRDNIRKIAQNA